MRYIIGDSETTGLSPQAKAVELAWLEVDEDLNILSDFSSLIDPGIPIEPGAMAIHGITEEMVAEAPTLEELLSEVLPGPYEGPTTLIAHNCLTGDHEVLTRSGWARLDSLTGDKVEAMMWQPENAALSFEQAVVVRNHYTGPMLKWDTNRHCGIYTPDHRVYFKTASTLEGPWRESTAAEVAERGPNSVAFPCSGAYEPTEPSRVSPTEARILEMIRADGSVDKVSKALRFKFKKPRKIARCQALLDLAGVHYRLAVDVVGATTVAVYKNSLTDGLITLLGAGKDKRLGSWVLGLSLAARQALLDETQYWDGHTRGRQRGEQSFELRTAKADEAQWFATAASVSGYCATYTLNTPNTRGFSRPDSVLSRVSFRLKSHVKTLEAPEKLASAARTVYCLNTSTGAFLVRREGRTWVTGNCKFDKRFFEPIFPITRTFCTLAFVRLHFPEMANHRLGTVKEHFQLDGGTAHRAMGDVLTVHQFLKKVLPMTGRTLHEHLNTPTTTVFTMPFGLHKGKALYALPVEYRTWLLSSDIPDDLRQSLMQLREASI